MGLLLWSLFLGAKAVPAQSPYAEDFHEDVTVRSLTHAQHTCSGYDEQWDLCSQLPSCVRCESVDCAFGQWGSWFDAGGCTQIQFRQRGVAVSNNECGKPCAGPKIQSRASPDSRCTKDEVDCRWEAWSAWTQCSSPNDQSTRSRTIGQENTRRGSPCVGEMKQTRPCSSGPSPQDCMMSDWREWSTCSSDCGEGQYSRFRRVVREASRGGHPCDGVIHQTETCQLRPCDSRDCEVSEWSEWSTSNPSEGHQLHTRQWFRERRVLVPPGPGGRQCPTSLSETVPRDRQPQQCVLSEWSLWSHCDRTCGGGQMMRERSLQASEVESDMELVKFVAWFFPAETVYELRAAAMRLADARSVLRVEPGAGLRAVRRAYREFILTRAEILRSFVKYDWLVCFSYLTAKPLVLEELRGCDTKGSEAIGLHSVEGLPTCPLHQIERAAAGSVASGKCVPGGPSQEQREPGCSLWSREQRQRQRDPDVREHHQRSEIGQCVLWCGHLSIEAGSPCRRIEGTHVRGTAGAVGCVACKSTGAAAGEPGHQDGFCGHHLLRMVSDCNTGSCSPMQTSDCQWSQWGEWSDCSARCGEGSKQRERRILSEALAGGTACEGPLKELSICQLSQCTLVDCRWADWGAWSDCSCECGGGTKRRTRGVMEAPRNGGKVCEPQDMEQAFPCNTQPCGSGCVDGQWGAWSSWTSCSATCSSSYQSRSRNLEIQPSSCGKAAAGPRDEYQVCSNLQPCIQDTDCQLHDWGEWSHCSCHCFGIRERNRFISHFATGKGNPCARAALKVIEPCNPGPIRPFDPDALDSLPLQLQMPPTDCQEKPPVDCELHDWTEWTRCSRTCGGGQRERSRTVRTAPKHGGQPCKSDLTTVEPCNLDPCHQVHCEDCRWGQWSDWGGCSKCGGQKYRHRSIIQMANHCGKPCDVRAAKETTNCTSECKTPLYCSWTEWSGATACAPCGPATTMRNRALGFSASDPGPGEWFFRVTGESECAGTQLNVSLCPSAGASCEHCVPQHCQFSEWGDWREPTCVGLCERERTIATINNECGNPCDGPMLMTKSCPVECTQPKDCTFSAWTEWSQCPVFASQSQRTRSRTIAQQPENEGRPCVGPLEETVACEYNHLKVDCAFSPWDPWSSCSRTCGSGGWKERTRNIADAAAGGGLQCKGGLTELVACDGAKVCDGYEKVDCQFAAWGSWSAPDTSNQRKRERKIVQMALHRGDACEGSLEEVESLPPVTSDCLVSEWSEWDNCDRDELVDKSRSFVCRGSLGEQTALLQFRALPTLDPRAPLLAASEVTTSGEDSAEAERSGTAAVELHPLQAYVVAHVRLFPASNTAGRPPRKASAGDAPPAMAMAVESSLVAESTHVNSTKENKKPFSNTVTAMPICRTAALRTRLTCALDATDATCWTQTWRA
ncbi:adt-1 [Symbiodinium microadriaticum]|nr:adt-1 [Symbiodinium microadriaticum]